MVQKHYIYNASVHHLNNSEKYKEISKQEAMAYNQSNFRFAIYLLIDQLKDENIEKYVNTKLLDIQDNTEAFTMKKDLELPYFYLLPKKHKSLSNSAWSLVE